MDGCIALFRHAVQPRGYDCRSVLGGISTTLGPPFYEGFWVWDQKNSAKHASKNAMKQARQLRKEINYGNG